MSKSFMIFGYTPTSLKDSLSLTNSSEMRSIGMMSFLRGFSNITGLLKRTRRKKVESEGVEDMMGDRVCIRER